MKKTPLLPTSYDQAIALHYILRKKIYNVVKIKVKKQMIVDVNRLGDDLEDIIDKIKDEA